MMDNAAAEVFSARRFNWLSPQEIAPFACATWIATVPTPPAAPSTRTVSSGRIAARRDAAGQRKAHSVVIDQQRSGFGVIEFRGDARHIWHRNGHLLGVGAQDPEGRKPLAHK